MRRLVAMIAVVLAGLICESSGSELNSLWPPCDFEGPYSMPDGGSVVGTVYDNFGHRVEFIFKRGSVPGDGSRSRRLYVGSRDWREGRLVERHSEEEELFIAILQRWIDDRVSGSQQEFYLHFATKDSEYPKGRREYLGKFNEEEKRALAGVLLIDSIKHELDRLKATMEEMRSRSKRSKER